MIRFATRTLLAFALASTVSAQVSVMGGNSERDSATRFLFTPDFQMLGAICIQYGQPMWKPEYDSMADSIRGKSVRLGKNWWTTMNTTIPFTINNTKVPAGSYYLGLHCDDKGGFHLLVLDSKNADAKSWTPFRADDWKADYTIALQHGKSTNSTEKLTIQVNGDKPEAMELKVAWGAHTLSAPVQAHPATAKAATKEASSDKDGDEHPAPVRK